MRFSVRRVDAGDAIVCELLRVLHDETFPSGSWVGGYPDFSIGEWWLAFNGKDEAGFLGMRVEKPGTGYLFSAGVRALYRGHGLMKALTRKCVARARAMGLVEIVSDAACWNAASLNSLIACGFRPFLPEKPWALPNSVYLRRVVCRPH